MVAKYSFSTGVLTAGTAVAAGTQPVSVTVDPSGRFAYAANWNSNSIWVYTINQASGALTPITAVSIVGGPPCSITTTGAIQ